MAMASRFVASQTRRTLLRRVIRAAPSSSSSASASCPAPCHLLPPHHCCLPGFKLSGDNVFSGRLIIRSMSTGIAQLPSISDPDILHALRQLMAVNWQEISDEARDAVDAAVNKKTDDMPGLEELKNAWRVAEAVEKFSGTLVSLRMALDDYSGASGDKVRQLSPVLSEALKSALSKYNTYLASFGDGEFYLKKKVEVELGSLLTHIKQRCSGLGPEWGSISLLGTSGISGSFIEHRAH